MKTLIIIGGGAAGFFSAINAAENNPGVRIIILEKSNKLLSKVKVSGGGRCNVCHATNSIADTILKYPRGGRFLKSAFHEFFTSHTVQWFNDHGVELKTEQDGRMFPQSNSSQTIIDCFLTLSAQYGVQIQLNKEVKKIEKPNVSGENVFKLFLKDGTEMQADILCIACGGYPKSEQYEWIRALGHSIEEPVPSLFTFNSPKHPITQLMGVSVEDVELRITGSKFIQRGPLLITHWGISGPAVLKLSAYAARELAAKEYKFSARINWSPSYNEGSLLNTIREKRIELAASKVGGKNLMKLPLRLWSFLLYEAGIQDDQRWGELSAKQQNVLAKIICNYEFPVHGKTTFKEEFVTAGGIELAEINAHTMESKLVPNLFFAGEILNIDGVTGGYNFQNAWTTGWIAAKNIRASIMNH